MPRLPSCLLVPAVALAVLGTPAALGLSAASAAPAPTAPPSATPAVPAPVLPPPPDPAVLAKAQAEVDALTAQAQRLTTQLTAGTVRLEQGQARLVETQTRAAAARAEADAAAARAEQARALLARVVNAAYRAPLPDAITLALSALPGRLEDAVLADAALEHVQGGQDAALQVAAEQGRQAAELATQADALQVQAQAEQRDLEAQVRALQAQAAGIRAELDVASVALATARGLSAAAGPATGPLDVSGGGALCAGASTVGYPNGYLPAAALCPLTVGGGHRLRADAAAAFNRLSAAHPVCVTDSYRSYAAQVDVYGRKPGLAAVPGTSNHGLGLAVDLCGGIETFGTPEHAWMQAHAAAYGFVHPAWAEPGGSRPEPWHWEYVGAGAVPGGPST